MYKIQDLIETYFLANNKLKLSQNSALIQMKILNKNKILNIELMEPTQISPYTNLATHTNPAKIYQNPAQYFQNIIKTRSGHDRSPIKKHCTKNENFLWWFLKYVWANLEEAADLFIFTKETLYEKCNFVWVSTFYIPMLIAGNWTLPVLKPDSHV